MHGSKSWKFYLELAAPFVGALAAGWGWPLIFGIQGVEFDALHAWITPHHQAVMHFAKFSVGLLVYLSLTLFVLKLQHSRITEKLEQQDCLRNLQNFRDDMERLIVNCEKVLQSKMPNQHQDLLRGRLTELLKETSESLEKMSRGRFSTSYWNCSLLTDRIRALSKGPKSPKIQMIGLTVWDIDKDWWGNDDAENFRKANREAIRSNFEITRIFVHSAEVPDAALLAEMQKHHEINVTVKHIPRNLLPLGEPVQASCVINEDFTYFAEVATIKRWDRNRFSVNPEDVRTIKKKLSLIADKARLWQPPN